MWRQFAIALSFLTVFRLPVCGEMSAADSGRCYACFPVVGLLIGLMTCGMVLLLRTVMPPILLAAWTCAFMALVTRGFHLDGLADLADGLGGGYTPQRRLEIMKDSATGAFGSTALIFAILLKTCAVYSLIMAGNWLVLAVIPVLGHFAIVIGAYKSHCARAEGLARSSIEHLSRGVAIAASAFAVAFTLLIVPRFAPALIGISLVIPLLVRLTAHRLLGGITGDVLGAINELTEVFLLTASACVPSL
jgi:adenosylcobinamide-GDP ribazoletransferase